MSRKNPPHGHIWENVWEAPYCGAFQEDVTPLGEDAYRKLLEQTDPSRHPYTVILLYPDYATGDYGADTFVHCARTESPEEAVEEVQKLAHQASVENGFEIPFVDFRRTHVFPGDLQCVLDATSTGEGEQS